MKYFLTFLFYLVCVSFLISNPIAGYNVQILNGPNAILTTFYDYFPSTKNGIAMRNQPNDEGGGVYAVFHAKEQPYFTKRAYFAYIDAYGNITNTATIGTEDVEEGFPSLDVDPETGDPIVAWNWEYGVIASYDLFHLGSCGLWRTPFVIFDEDTPSLHPDDYFLYPVVEIGHSPIPNKRRVYVVCRNQRIPNLAEEFVNAMLAYADFDVNDFNALSTLDWTYVQLQFSDENYIEEYDPYFYTFTTSDAGHVALVGTSYYHDVFALINENYGEGAFTFYSELYEFPVDNPLNLDGTPRFVDEQGNPHDLFFAPLRFTNTNAIFTDNDSKIIFPTSFALTAEPDIFFDNELLVYPKLITFDLNDVDFTFKNIHIESEYPSNPELLIPWDIDDNGIVDSYDLHGTVDYVPSWSIYYPYTTNIGTHDLNHFRIAQNEQMNFISIYWNDGARAKLAEQGSTGYTSWWYNPEIAVTYSDNGGITWHDTQFLNSLQNPELNGMIPEYIFSRLLR